MIRRLSRRLPPLLFLTLGVVPGCSDCLGLEKLGGDAAREITGSVDTFVTQMPALLDTLDDLLENNIDGLGDALAQQIQETSNLLRSTIDGLNTTLNGTIDNVDAMLAARMKQLFQFTQDFVNNVDDIVKRRTNQLTYNLQELIKALEISGTELLETAGFQVVRTIREGNKVVAVVIGGVVETVMLWTAGLVLGLALILGGLFFMKMVRRAQPASVAQWVPGTAFFGVVVVIASLVLFVPSVRASIASQRVDMGDDSACQEVLPLAGSFVGLHRSTAPGGLAAQDQEKALDLLGKLYQCEVSAAPSSLRSEAVQRVGDIERMLGLTPRCRKNEQCDAARGEHCEVTTGLCTDRCRRNEHCAQGSVCHDEIGACGPPCSKDADCKLAGLACTARGLCEPKGAEQPPSGGGGRPRPGLWVPGGLLGHLVKVDIFKKCVGAGCPRPERDPGVVDPAPERRTTLTNPALNPHLRRAAAEHLRINLLHR